MYKIAAMGDRDSISGFAAIGLTLFPVEQADQATQLLRQLAQSDYAVIYITEQLASEIEAEIDRYQTHPTPAIVLIPGVRGNTGLGMANVSKSVERAVGSDIIN